MRNFAMKAALVAAGLGSSVAAFAAGPDLTTLTSAIDFGTVTTAVLAVGASIVGVYLAWKGAKILIGAVKGA